MDVDCSVSGASASAENNSVSDIPVDELSCSLSGKLKVNPEKQTGITNTMQESHVDAYYIEDENESSNEEEEDEELSEEELLTQMGYAKSTPKRERTNRPRKKETFNAVDKQKEDDDLSEGFLLTQTVCVKNGPPWHKPMTTPGVHINLVPALKGSRERWGGPSGERRVSWAPDVYDPPPTYSEFLRPAHQPELRAGKNQQKDGEGKPGGGKGKKSGGSKLGVERWKTEGAKDKNKKYDNKKQTKKRGGRGGGGGGGGGGKFLEFGEF